MSPILKFLEVAGLRFGLPICACLTKGELPLKSLTLPKFMSLENICAIEGIEKDELLEALKVIFSKAMYLKEILGSNDESFSNSSNRPLKH